MRINSFDTLTNNTYTNIVTGDTYDMTGWSYDYSDRSYTIDLSTGDTVSVTYGDENITIYEGGTTYTVYYVIQQPPQTTDNPVLPDHTHHWTSNGDTVQPTCTLNGYKPYICTECGEEYRDVLYATGHDWLFQELVPAVYDEETGELVSSSYNIYYCTNCQETTIVPIGGDPPVVGVSELNSFAANLMGWLNNFMVFIDGKIDSLIGEINFTLDHLFDELNLNLDDLIGELSFDFSSHTANDSSGHDWEFVEFVPAVYDTVTGELVSSAYNLYKCLNCGETVQVQVSHPPDSSGSGSDGGGAAGGDGGEEDDACVHDWEFVKFVPAVYDEETEELVTSAYNLYQCLNCGDTVRVNIETTPDEAADDLCPEMYSWAERLAAYLSSRWNTVISSVTAFFAALPNYFSDFTRFLTVAFAVFPAEIKSGMVVFVLAFVFVGIIKVLRG